MPRISLYQRQDWAIAPIRTDRIGLGACVRRTGSLAHWLYALIALFLLLLVGVGVCVAEAGPPADKTHVLLLNSYHAGMDWTDGETAGVREVLQRDRKSTRLNSSHEDLSRMPSSA